MEEPCGLGGLCRLLLWLKCLRWAYVRVVSVSFALEAEDCLVLNIVLLIFSKHPVQVVLLNLFLLAVCRLVSLLAAPVAADTHDRLLERQETGHSRVLVGPVLSLREVGKDAQRELGVADHALDVLLVAVRP